MRAVDIKIEQLTSFLAKDLRISHCPNEHAMLQIEGSISDAEVETVHRFAVAEEPICVSAQGEGATWKWCGMVYDVEIQHLFHEKYLKLVLVSPSIKMDRKQKTRSFQDKGTTIGDIINYVCQDYNALVTLNGADIPAGGMIVQYQETDWEFVKRLASHLNQQIIVHTQFNDLVMDVGFSGAGGTANITGPCVYQKDFQALYRGADYALSDADVDIVRVESRELYDIMSCLQTDKGVFYIYRIDSMFQQEELVLHYEGYRESNFKTPFVKNEKIVGASLNGTVHAVSGTKIQVNLDVDANNSLCGWKDFPYATVYSSNAGTGWYCMPEVGDTVRVYFPSAAEDEAYATSSVHLDVAMDDSRSNPQIKSISNAQKKQIVFYPEGILLQNTENMYVSLDDTAGITIVSDLPINILSDTSITLNAAEDIMINGMSQVVLKQGLTATTIKQDGAEEITALGAPDTSDATILMSEGNITVSGVEFRLQENEGV